mmetsp:Transcript_18908/g.48343  ORF Transcript_18908/g.48343 Transcript_18908/m.48343 type:complete len:279 (-) Transcript_18908:2538-3374(-)
MCAHADGTCSLDRRTYIAQSNIAPPARRCRRHAASGRSRGMNEPSAGLRRILSHADLSSRRHGRRLRRELLPLHRLLDACTQRLALLERELAAVGSRPEARGDEETRVLAAGGLDGFGEEHKFIEIVQRRRVRLLLLEVVVVVAVAARLEKGVEVEVAVGVEQPAERGRLVFVGAVHVVAQLAVEVVVVVVVVIVVVVLLLVRLPLLLLAKPLMQRHPLAHEHQAVGADDGRRRGGWQREHGADGEQRDLEVVLSQLGGLAQVGHPAREQCRRGLPVV